MDAPKEIRADAKLKNLPEAALEELWRYRNPEEGGEKMTLEAIAVEVPLRWGFTVSLSTLSEFYCWLRLKRRMDAAAERAAQTKLELAKDPSFSSEEIERVAQTVFTAETLETGDVKGFVALAKLRLNARKLDQDERRIALLEAKAAKADQADEVAKNGTMSSEEKQARMREIFGF